MFTAAAKRYTVAEYLAFERASETKYLDGRIWARGEERDVEQKAT